jgi:hypothetical protein
MHDPLHLAIADNLEQRSQHATQAAAGNNRCAFITGVEEFGLILYRRILLLLVREIFSRHGATDVKW